MSIYNTITQMESDTNRINYERGRANLGQDRLDNASFLQLMMAQLKYQDPTDPVDNNQFLQQQAMMAQVDGIQELNKNMSDLLLTNQVGQVSNMVGKYVKLQYQDQLSLEQITLTGQVDSMVIEGGIAKLKMDGKTYTMNMVTQISNTPISLGESIPGTNETE